MELDVTRKRMKNVRIKEPDGSILLQPVVYEWLPTFCAKGLTVGHDCSTAECQPVEGKPELDREEWRPKISELFEGAVERSTKASKHNAAKAKADKNLIIQTIRLVTKEETERTNCDRESITTSNNSYEVRVV